MDNNGYVSHYTNVRHKMHDYHATIRSNSIKVEHEIFIAFHIHHKKKRRHLMHRQQDKVLVRDVAPSLELTLGNAD